VPTTEVMVVTSFSSTLQHLGNLATIGGKQLSTPLHMKPSEDLRGWACLQRAVCIFLISLLLLLASPPNHCHAGTHPANTPRPLAFMRLGRTACGG
jgi:hypothetical protein